jgi:hypothetical protein
VILGDSDCEEWIFHVIELNEIYLNECDVV